MRSCLYSITAIFNFHHLESSKNIHNSNDEVIAAETDSNAAEKARYCDSTDGRTDGRKNIKVYLQYVLLNLAAQQLKGCEGSYLSVSNC